jgi:sugar lactone lactonase YvrE
MRAFALLALAATASAQYPYVITTVAGSNPLGDGGLATSALIENPRSVAVDTSGKIYLTDTGNARIRVVTPDGVINTFLSPTNYPASLAADSLGNVYLSDGFIHIYKIAPSGAMTVIAGTSFGFSGDNGPATSAQLGYPEALTVDSQGNIYFVDSANVRVRKISTSGTITTVAGNGVSVYQGDNGAALIASLNNPNSVAVDSAGNLYIAEDFRIRKVTPGGIITTYAGNGFCCSSGPVQEGVAAVNANLNQAPWVLYDPRSNSLYVADPYNYRIRVISPDGTIRTVAGSADGFSGDGGPAAAALLGDPMGPAFDAGGNLYFADHFNHRIRRISTAGIITTVAGRTHFAGDGGPATSAILHWPEAVVGDRSGDLYINDRDNGRIRKVTPDGVTNTIAGYGYCTYSGVGSPAIDANFCSAEALLTDATGNLYIADGANGLVRRIDPAGTITAVAGNTISSVLAYPWGLAMDSAGSLYISEQAGNRVRKLSSSGVLTTVAGTGVAGFSGDGGQATSAQLYYPRDLAVDARGNLYISDYGNGRVRVVDAGTGGITTFPGALNLGFPGGVAIDSSGYVYVARSNPSLVSRISPAGQVTDIAGIVTPGYASDGVIANTTPVNGPAGLWLDPSGDLYFADQSNSRIRKLTLNSPASLQIIGGDMQTETAGRALPLPLTVKLLGRGRVGVSGAPVTFTVTSGPASLSASAAVTDAAGMASVAVKLGHAPGPVVIMASSPGVQPVTFSVTAAAVPPVRRH